MDINIKFAFDAKWLGIGLGIYCAYKIVVLCFEYYMNRGDDDNA